MDERPSTRETARRAGRGLIWISAAKAYFILSGVALITFLPQFIGRTDQERAELYGDFTVVIGILNPLTMMMITGVLQAVSRFVSEDPRRYRAVRRESTILQAIFGFVVASGFALLAPWIARLLGDVALTPYLQSASVIILFYSIYAALVGGLNGLRRFGTQAVLDTAFATLKVGLILTLTALGFGVMGAVVGFAATSGLMLVVVWVISSRRAQPTDGAGVGWRRLLRFEAWIMGFALAANLLMNADLYVVKALGPGDAATGIYAVALQVARLPYIAVISVTFVVFPLVSAASGAENLIRMRGYIETTVRYVLILTVCLAVTLSAAAADVLRLAFAPIFFEGWPLLSVLPLAYAGYALMIVFATILTGSGRPVQSLILAGVTLLLSVVANAFAIAPFGLFGAAVATASAMLLGAGLGWCLLVRSFKPAFPWATFGRLGLASLAVYATSAFWQPEARGLIVAKGLILLTIFIGLLVLMKELRAEDSARFKAVISHKRSE